MTSRKSYESVLLSRLYVMPLRISLREINTFQLKGSYTILVLTINNIKSVSLPILLAVPGISHSCRPSDLRFGQLPQCQLKLDSSTNQTTEERRGFVRPWSNCQLKLIQLTIRPNNRGKERFRETLVELSIETNFNFFKMNVKQVQKYSRPTD